MGSGISLKEYISALEGEGLLIGRPAADSEVSFLPYDSRKVVPGTLFICKGESFKPEYLSQAYEKGAVCALSAKSYGLGPELLVSDIRRAMAVASNVYDGKAWESFRLIGLTGTKGKSTAAYFIKSVAEKWGVPLGYLTTIDTFDGVELFESHLTTPEAPELAERFLNAKKSGLWGMVMEVSSQALKYDWTYGLTFDMGCFMNYGVDHIGTGEHPTEEDYIASKLRIFRQCKRACVNLDSDRIEDILRAAEEAGCELVFYSPEGNCEVLGQKPSYRALNVRKDGGNTVFTIEGPKESFEVSIGIPGLFNVENALCAAVICLELGAPKEAVIAGLRVARAAGRMELFRIPERGIEIIVDYAHNELSFEKLFSSVKAEFPGRRIEAVFGCPGGKGLIRREALPRVAARYADKVWLTEEDPGFEDVNEILSEVHKNLVKYGGKGCIVTDRKQAITRAAAEAPDGTVIVVAAKGREKYMKRGSVYVPVESDAEIVAGLPGVAEEQN